MFDMTTEQLLEFLVLSETHSYKEAARNLFISQSMLTRHIQNMENELGVQLLQRSAHAVTLTNAGKLLASQADTLLNAAKHAVMLANADVPIPRGRLRIACSLELSYANHIKSFLKHFTEVYRDIELDMTVFPGSMQAVLTESYDIILTPCNWIDLPLNMNKSLLRTHSTYLLIPPGHAFMARSTISLNKLANETLLVPYADEVFGPYCQNWNLTERATHGKANKIPVENVQSAVFQLTLGLGVFIAPGYVRNLLPDDMRTASFSIAISEKRCSYNEYIYCRDYEQNGAARMFYDELLKYNDPYWNSHWKKV